MFQRSVPVMLYVTLNHGQLDFVVHDLSLPFHHLVPVSALDIIRYRLGRSALRLNRIRNVMCLVIFQSYLPKKDMAICLSAEPRVLSIRLSVSRKA